MCVQKGPATQAAEEQQIMAQIQALVKELAKCAPHPDKPQDKGPQFLQSSDYTKQADENDAMLGTIIAESMLGSAFSSAVSESATHVALNAWNSAETASTVYTDRQSSPFKIGQRSRIANDFNTQVSRSPEYMAMRTAYLEDLPHRLHLEKWISHEMRKLYAHKKYSQQLQYAA